jgi:hypothetical protein
MSKYLEDLREIGKLDPVFQIAFEKVLEYFVLNAKYSVKVRLSNSEYFVSDKISAIKHLRTITHNFHDMFPEMYDLKNLKDFVEGTGTIFVTKFLLKTLREAGFEVVKVEG